MKRIGTAIGTLALALGATLMMATTANAEIIYVDNATLVANNGGDSSLLTASALGDNTELFLDVGNKQASYAGVPAADFQVDVSSALGFYALADLPAGVLATDLTGAYAKLLTYGGLIDSSGTYSQYPAGDPGFWNPEETTETTAGYIGFKLTNGDLGWAHFTYYPLGNADFPPGDGTLTPAITLSDFAYNNVAGAPITAGQVPEPSTLVLAFLAATIFVAVRVLRKKKATA